MYKTIPLLILFSLCCIRAGEIGELTKRTLRVVVARFAVNLDDSSIVDQVISPPEVDTEVLVRYKVKSEKVPPTDATISSAIFRDTGILQQILIDKNVQKVKKVGINSSVDSSSSDKPTTITDISFLCDRRPPRTQAVNNFIYELIPMIPEGNEEELLDAILSVIKLSKANV